MGFSKYLQTKARGSITGKRLTSAFMVFVLAWVLTGCATFSPTKEALETKPNINARTYDAPPQFCFLALKRIFLKNNFTLLKEDTQLNKIEAIKHFDKGNLSVDLLIQANLESMENNKTQVYLNAVQTTKTIYATRKTLLIIPLPGSTQVTQATKEGTIEDKKFYEVFFKAIEEELKTLRQ